MDGRMKRWVRGWYLLIYSLEVNEERKILNG
jgi:hypothetical protein